MWTSVSRITLIDVFCLWLISFKRLGALCGSDTCFIHFLYLSKALAQCHTKINRYIFQGMALSLRSQFLFWAIPHPPNADQTKCALTKVWVLTLLVWKDQHQVLHCSLTLHDTPQEILLHNHRSHTQTKILSSIICTQILLRFSFFPFF